MTITTKQLGLLLLLLCALTLTLAWIIERRQVLSFRQELDAYGNVSSSSTMPWQESTPAADPLAEPSPDAPLPFVPPPAEPVDIDEVTE